MIAVLESGSGSLIRDAMECGEVALSMRIETLISEPISTL
jgi:hypothetical protein